MNLASIIVLCIVVGLFGLSVVCFKNTSMGKCCGDCAECGFQCSRKSK